MVDYLSKLQEKCNVPERLISIISSLFERLLDFGYISNKQVKKLSEKLYNNIDTVILENYVGVDYKSGYYDAVKKELYIKDINNIESVYLRILYVLTTTQTTDNTFLVGYSSATLSSLDYKIIHKNFGINRAIISNLVCRLLYTIPATLSIVPTYRTFSSDFLGNEIKSDNDIYFLEGKLLSQICYTLNLEEEDLYNNLFTSSPNKFLIRFFGKSKIKDLSSLLLIFDNISRTYSNYNKLCFLNNELDINYINIKKNILNNNIEEFKKEEKIIKLAIEAALVKLSPENNNENNNEIEIAIESSLSEKINELEEKVINLISSLQNTLVDVLISEEFKYSAIMYAIKLKTLDKILVIQNKKLKETLFETIIHNLLSYGENTASNLIEKIKYSIVNEIISSDKYIKIYKNLYFKKLESLGNENKNHLVALNVDNEFLQLIEISSLSKSTKKLENNTKKVQLENLGYLLNNPSSISSNISTVEKIITCIRSSNEKFNNVKLENIYITDYDNFNLVIILEDNNFEILKLTIKNSELNLKQVKLTENFSVFNFDGSSSNLPVTYPKKENPIKKILSLFNIF